jgi:hypothetical protein
LSFAAEGVRVIRHASNRGAAAARNTGARAAKGEWLLFVDSDIQVDPGAPERIRETLESHPEIALTFGVYSEDPPHSSWLSAYKNSYWRHKFLVLPSHTANLNTALMAVRRDAFEAVGMFNEETIIGEDRELGQAMGRRGYRTHLDKRLEGRHGKTFDLRSLLEEHFSSAVNATLVMLATPVEIRSEDGEVLGASTAYLASIAAAAAGTLALGIGWLTSSPPLLWISAALGMSFLVLTVPFLRACAASRGVSFALVSFGLSYVEAIVAAAGVLLAAVRYFLLGNPKRDFRLSGSRRTPSGTAGRS